MIDLNCDLGEGFGRWTLGDEAELLAVVTSANIACGLHAGDPHTLRVTIDLAWRHGVAVGAHPGYPDLQGFGRRELALSAVEIEESVLYQIGAVYGFARAAQVPLTHVKPHGALYNRAAVDRPAAEAIARALHSFDPGLILVGLAGSEMIAAGEAAGLVVAREAFADRAYEPNGTLRPRALPGAVLHDTEAIVAQAVGIARERRVMTNAGSIPVAADTICLHGDTPGAVDLAKAIRRALDEAGIAVRPLVEVIGVGRRH